MYLSVVDSAELYFRFLLLSLSVSCSFFTVVQLNAVLDNSSVGHRSCLFGCGGSRKNCWCSSEVRASAADAHSFSHQRLSAVRIISS